MKNNYIGFAQKILDREPEDWLSYLYGQNSKKIPVSRKKNVIQKGWWLGSLNFIGNLLRNTSIRADIFDSSNAPVDWLIFASTQNQIDALASTYESLASHGCQIFAIRTKSKIKTKTGMGKYHWLKFSVIDVLRSVTLFMLRGPKLYFQLKNRGDESLLSHFDSFFMNYAYLVYFYRILEQIRPEFVITANDHSPENRCLLVVAQELNIKTVYLQHATVSSLFPALKVNYAFLDGEFSLKVYRECEANQFCFSSSSPNPTVFLTGQKKSLPSKHESARKFIGVAINGIDHASAAVHLVNTLTDLGFQVSFRWHPAQSRDDVLFFRRRLTQNSGVRLSDPESESVGDYLGDLRCLVAGNSSILLEAAIVEVVPIFYEIEPTQLTDYYKFVENGIAISANSLSRLIEALKQFESLSAPDEKSVQYYSATFATEWQGCEGELVARILMELSASKSTETQGNLIKSSSFGPYSLF